MTLLAQESTASVPKTPISLQLWVVTIALPQNKAQDEVAANLYERTTRLPVAVGSYNDVITLVERLRAAGLIEKMREFRHAAVNGETSQTQSGATVPTITGSATRSPRASGGLTADRVNQIQYKSIGTVVQLNPLIESNGELRVQLYYETSEIEKSPNVTISESEDGTNRILADQTVMRHCQANVRLKSGSAALVQSDTHVQSTGDAVKRTTLIILSATILDSAQ
jgi:hypothetical protein